MVSYNNQSLTNKDSIHVNILSSRNNIFNEDDEHKIELGANIGKGTYSYVYTIKNEPKYVIKLMKPSYKRSELDLVKNGKRLIAECKHFYMSENYREIDIVKQLIKSSKDSNNYPNNLVEIIAYGQITTPTTLQTKSSSLRHFPKGTYIIIEKYYRCFQKYFKTNCLKEVQLIKFVFDLKQAFKQLLNVTGYIHLDPKLSNIYISNDGTKFLLSDFNLVQKCNSDKDIFSSYGKYYLHPRKRCPLLSLPYYSLAITLLEICFDKNRVFTLNKIDSDEYSKYLDKIMYDYKKKTETVTELSLYNFIAKCLHLNCRLTMQTSSKLLSKSPSKLPSNSPPNRSSPSTSLSSPYMPNLYKNSKYPSPSSIKKPLSYKQKEPKSM